MKTMNTVKVAQWLSTKGMIKTSENFLSLFGHIEDVDYEGIEGFLYIYYRKDTEDVFRSMQCEVTTSLNLDTV